MSIFQDGKTQANIETLKFVKKDKLYTSPILNIRIRMGV